MNELEAILNFLLLQGEEATSGNESSSDSDNYEKNDDGNVTEKYNSEPNKNEEDVVKKKVKESVDEDNTSDEEVDLGKDVVLIKISIYT